MTHCESVAQEISYVRALQIIEFHIADKANVSRRIIYGLEIKRAKV